MPAATSSLAPAAHGLSIAASVNHHYERETDYEALTSIVARRPSFILSSFASSAANCPCSIKYPSSGAEGSRPQSHAGLLNVALLIWSSYIERSPAGIRSEVFLRRFFWCPAALL